MGYDADPPGAEGWRWDGRGVDFSAAHQDGGTHLHVAHTTVRARMLVRTFALYRFLNILKNVYHGLITKYGSFWNFIEGKA